MAKYKFTKTIKPAEGICIGVSGNVLKLPVPSILMSKRLIAPTRNKPVVVVPLSSENNPYYGERALYNVPPARPCGMFGLSRPKPITRTAAMSFQNRGA